MRQYSQIKQKNPDAILLFRMGDFFETFEGDAEITAKVCGITLTKRNNGEAGEVPLAGFPHHQLDNYLPKLVRAGYRVAVCEQLEDPKLARGIVRRGVVEIVTPGVAMNDKLLDSKRNNYLAALHLFSQKSGQILAGVACVDVSTGHFFTSEVNVQDLGSLLEILSPAEIVVSKPQHKDITAHIEELSISPILTRLEDWIFDRQFAMENLLRHFKTTSLKGFGAEEQTAGIIAAGAALHYVSETQQGGASQIKRMNVFNPSEFMTLDFATRRNLEIVFSMNDLGREGTLISILDKTKTPMGGRMFKQWITRPLRTVEPIKRRLSAVRALVEHGASCDYLRSEMSEVGDIERLISKISTGRANPRDVVSLKKSLQKIPSIQSILTEIKSETIQKLSSSLLPLDEVVGLIEQALDDDVTVQLGTGACFRQGFSEEIDMYREAMYSGKNWIANYQATERETTGIPSLKVSFNNVFGYYIEITNTHKNKAPEHYNRKQTISTGERYTTPELKEIETKILTAEEKISEVEIRLFSELRTKIAEFTEQIQILASRIAALDCIQSFAHVAREYDYCEPEIDNSTTLNITNGRHPVVERVLPLGEHFSPNNTSLSTDTEQIHIITGPNMSGKSCYLRQVGLIVLLAQIGCYVPATSAHIGLVDRIFTRVGAQDNITAGESTFLVEMQEAANILNNASDRSLILLDEVGRGTATFDGISIAWAIAEYLHESTGAKTLFATHYHELNDLAGRFERICNYKVEVQEIGNSVIFTHKVTSGASDHSFGIHVAKMAGLPQLVIDRATEILQNLEQKGEKSIVTTSTSSTKDEGNYQLSFFEIKDDALREKIRNLDLNQLTPIMALQTLAELQKEAGKKNKK
ncbi:MAG: DNA mismatch repair protein MutS [Bacteroidetes bacterium]|nr:DNA mismatch repair protein MutS [Bacteroidota bacterium]